MSEMDVDAKKRKKDAKKEKKLKKERKKEKAARAAASSTRGGLEEVYEDEIEVSMMGHTNQQYKGDPHDHIGLNDDQHISIDDDGGVVDSHRKVRSELSSSRPNGGAEVDEEIDLDAELMEEMAANEADLDLDYHPPPPKTTQQIAIAGVLLLLLGVIELLLFGYLSTPIDVWSLVTSGSILVMNGILGIRAAHDNTIVKAYHYRFSLQVYMVLIVMLSTINIVILNVQPCIAPCVSTKACVQPFGATDTCARVLVNTIAISAFGLFFPLFLFCLPCYLGSRIHIENLESQFNAAGPKSTPPYLNQHHSETRSNYRNQEDERKY